MQSSQITFKYLWLNKTLRLNGPLDTKAGAAVDASRALFRQPKLLCKTGKKRTCCFECSLLNVIITSTKGGYDNWHLFACLTAWKTTPLWTDSNDILRKCWQWAEKQTSKVWQCSGIWKALTFNPWPLMIKKSTLWCNYAYIYLFFSFIFFPWKTFFFSIWGDFDASLQGLLNKDDHWTLCTLCNMILYR